MEIIPAIAILDGENVALYKGNLEQRETYNKSPLETARLYERQGAKKLYVADINGKNEKKFVQRDVVKKILDAVGIPVILEAGFSTAEEIQQALDLGVYQVVLRSPPLPFAKEIMEKIGPEKIMVQLYSRRSELIENHHVKKNADDFTDVVDYAEKLVPLGVRYVMYKDLQSEGTLIHPNYDELDRLYLTTGKSLKIYASGGIAEMKHIILLKKIGTAGAIINKAFQERKLSIAEAQEVAGGA